MYADVTFCFSSPDRPYGVLLFYCSAPLKLSGSACLCEVWTTSIVESWVRLCVQSLPSVARRGGTSDAVAPSWSERVQCAMDKSADVCATARHRKSRDAEAAGRTDARYLYTWLNQRRSQKVVFWGGGYKVLVNTMMGDSQVLCHSLWSKFGGSLTKTL